MSKSLCILVAAALASAAPAAVTYAAGDYDHVGASTGKRHVAPRTAGEPRGQIACGKYGCTRIPPNCHPEQTYDPRGNPTGWDAVICR